MIKGINRQVIEVQETDNIYYEKALLFLRPEFSKAQKSLLEREAKLMVKNMKSPAYMKNSKRFFYWFVRLFSSAIVGGLISAFLFFCFYN